LKAGQMDGESREEILDSRVAVARALRFGLIREP
jgi:hypothetical protein